MSALLKFHRDHILYDSFYIKCPEKQTYRIKKYISDCLGLGEMRVEGWG